ncbi:MAG: FecR domain-containing protein, partial [Prevotella sp.]
MKQCRHLLLTLLLLMAALPIAAQTGTVTLSFDDEPLPSAFKKLEKASDYKISFVYSDVEKYRVSGQVKNKPFEAALQFLLSGKPLSYEIKGKFVDI